MRGQFNMFCRLCYALHTDQSRPQSILSYNLVFLFRVRKRTHFSTYVNIQNEKFVPNSTEIFFTLTLSKAHNRDVKSLEITQNGETKLSAVWYRGIENGGYSSNGIDHAISAWE